MLSTTTRAPLSVGRVICTAITQVQVSHNVLLGRRNGMLTGMQAQLVPRIVTLAAHTTLRDDKHPHNFNCIKSSLLLRSGELHFAPAGYQFLCGRAFCDLLLWALGNTYPHGVSGVIACLLQSDDVGNLFNEACKIRDMGHGYGGWICKCKNEKPMGCGYETQKHTQPWWKMLFQVKTP
jgi:hypothetical protein